MKSSEKPSISSLRKTTGSFAIKAVSMEMEDLAARHEIVVENRALTYALNVNNSRVTR